MKNDDKQIQDIFRNIPDKFAVMKEGVDPAIQREYLSYAERIDLSRYTEKDIAIQSQGLFDPGVPAEEKKKALVLLAHTGTLESYRRIEQFLETAQEQDLQGWGVLAIGECRMFLESDWDENVGTLITGLGGEGNKLRYFFVVRSKNNAGFTGAQSAMLTQAFPSICDRFGATLEELKVHQEYAALKMLIPLDVAVATVIESGIDECNACSDFLDDGYYVTNERVPTEAEIQYYLREW